MKIHPECTNFIKLNFYQIVELKRKGYSWKEILTEINSDSSKELEQSCSLMFTYIAKKMGNDEKTFNRYRQGIKEFVMINIDRIRSMRACGFNWDEIIDKFHLRARFPLSKNLRSAIRRYFAEANRR